jgi:predicted O-methyltransferase YrrM
MALPALKLVRPHLRPGATIVADNIIASAARYADLLAYVDADPAFQRITVPYHKGLAVIVYYPEK